jgi:hypothetical protein
MNFDQRKHRAKEMLATFLSIFSPPRGLDDSQLADRISQTADAFARRMPTKGDYDQAVEAVFMKIRDTHMSNSWPPQAAFVLAMPKGETMSRPAAETYTVADAAERYSRLMEAGEPIPETALWGALAHSLPHQHLDRYRNACVMAWMDLHGEGAANLMYSKYGATVLPYFPQEAAQ